MALRDVVSAGLLEEPSLSSYFSKDGHAGLVHQWFCCWRC